MEQKFFYSHIPYSHNVPYGFLGRNSVHFGRPPPYFPLSHLQFSFYLYFSLFYRPAEVTQLAQQCTNDPKLVGSNPDAVYIRLKIWKKKLLVSCVFTVGRKIDK